MNCKNNTSVPREPQDAINVPVSSHILYKNVPLVLDKPLDLVFSYSSGGQTYLTHSKNTDTCC